MARLLLGVSGGIAAYKAVETARLAIKAGHAVRVITTPTAERFVGRATFEGDHRRPGARRASSSPTRRAGPSPASPLPARAPISHLALVERAQVLPDRAGERQHDRQARRTASPTTCSSTAALAAACPVAVAPAMNNRMYLHPATQANLALLAERGVTIIDPGEGELASHGEHGIGRLAEPAALLAACEALLRSPDARRRCACSSPPAARASRSTASATSATARRGGWASRSRPRRPAAAPR